VEDSLWKNLPSFRRPVAIQNIALGNSVNVVLLLSLEIHRNATLLIVSIILVFSVSRTEELSIEMERSAVT